MPAAFDAACSRSPACAQAAPGPAWERVVALAERLRAGPVSGVVPGPDGAIEKVSMDAVGLVDLINDAAGDPHIYRELDAAARALLDAGDPAPLLRLYAQRLAEDEDYFGLPVQRILGRAVPGGLLPRLSAAVQHERQPPGPRAASSRPPRRRSRRAPSARSTTAEWIAQNQNTEAYTACLDWPSPTVAQPPIDRQPPLLPATLPVLVLGGELDTWTPPAGVPEGARRDRRPRALHRARQLHPRGRRGRHRCGGSTLVQRVRRRSAALESLDASCAAACPPIHTVGTYADPLAEEPPLHAAPARRAAPPTSAGGRGRRHRRRRDRALRGRSKPRSTSGLAGGTVKASHGGAVLTLHGDRLIPEVAVSGTVTLTPAADQTTAQTVAGDPDRQGARHAPRLLHGVVDDRRRRRPGAARRQRGQPAGRGLDARPVKRRARPIRAPGRIGRRAERAFACSVITNAVYL